jgi:signal transduction histidine kinase
MLGFVASLVFFVIRTTAALKKPIDILQDAMNNFDSDSGEVSEDYSVPSELVRIADSFNEISRKLAESEKERNELESERLRLLTNISHDFRKPLSDIKRYAVEALTGQGRSKDEKELSEYQREYLEIIARKTDYLSDLVDSFYEYIKLQNPEYEIIKSNDDICEYVREYFAYKNPDLVREGYNVHLDIPNEPIARPYDFVQMRRVFENIINNIINCNPDGTDIFVSITRRSNKAVICIGDDGIGVPEDARDTLFMPFVVKDDVNTVGKGTELGMTIAKSILEAHGATIRLMDPAETEHKTMFEIVL